MSRLDINIHRKNQPPRFIMNACLISCFLIGSKYGYQFASEYSLFIKILSALLGGFTATLISEEVYYWSRNSSKSIRTIACILGSFAGASLSVLLFILLKYLF